MKDWFIKHNVEVIAESNITEVGPSKLYNHDQVIEVDAVVWTAGVQPVKIVREMDVEKDHNGRPIVNQYFQLVDDENVYVIGDCASSDLPPSAQLAEEQAERVVQVLKKRWNDEPLPEKMSELN